MGTDATWAYRMLFATHWLAGNRTEALAAARKWREPHPKVTRAVLLAQIPLWRHDPDDFAVLHSIWQVP